MGESERVRHNNDHGNDDDNDNFHNFSFAAVTARPCLAFGSWLSWPVNTTSQQCYCCRCYSGEFDVNNRKLKCFSGLVHLLGQANKGFRHFKASERAKDVFISFKTTPRQRDERQELAEVKEIDFLQIALVGNG